MRRAFDPKVGQLVCDCRYRHLRVLGRSGDTAYLEDGFTCSVRHCLDPVPHRWAHPPDAVLHGWPAAHIERG